MSIDPNRRVKEYLEVYKSDTRPFALMLDGAWGSGKTFLVREAMRGSTTHLHVSLNGTNEIADVLDSLYYEAYPVLADKTVRALGSVAKTIAGAFRIKANLSKDDLLALDKFDTLIFDDLERSSIEPRTILGFINSFVEKDAKRVIIIANSSEIDTDTHFERIKEKVVGRTLLVQPDFESAFSIFCNDKSIDYKSFLLENKTAITRLFYSSKMNNLRASGYCIDEFGKTHAYLFSKKVSSLEILHIFTQFIALSYFYRIGIINENHLSEIGNESLVRAMRKARPDYTADILDEINENIDEVDILQQHLDTEYLRTYITQGVHDPAYLSRTVGDLLGKSDASLNPDWRNLWYLVQQSDTVIKDSYKSFISKFEDRKYVDSGEILHAFGLLYTLRDAGLNRWTDKKILEKSKEYVDDLFHQRSLPILGDDFITSFRHGAAHGLGLSNLSNPNMQAAMQYYRDKSEILRSSIIIENLIGAFSFEEFDVDTLREILLDGSSPDSSYRTPVLQTLDASVFVSAFFKTSADKRLSILQVLRSRYNSSSSSEVRSVEAPWLRKIAIGIVQRAERSSKLQKFKITEILRLTLMEYVVTSQPTQ